MTNINGFIKMLDLSKISHYFYLYLIGWASWPGTDSINRALVAHVAHVQEPKSCDHAVTARTGTEPGHLFVTNE